MKKIKNKWQCHFRFGHDPRFLEQGWREVQFGILNIVDFPPEGQYLTKKYYKGFLIKFKIWFPIDF